PLSNSGRRHRFDWLSLADRRSGLESIGVTIRLGVLMTHPVQYISPWFSHLAQHAKVCVYYAHKQTPSEQARAGFGVPFEWDIPLFEGYRFTWLENKASQPSVSRFHGCDTPEIEAIMRRERFDAFLMFGWNKKCFLQAGWAAIRN